MSIVLPRSTLYKIIITWTLTDSFIFTGNTLIRKVSLGLFSVLTNFTHETIKSSYTLLFTKANFKQRCTGLLIPINTNRTKNLSLSVYIYLALKMCIANDPLAHLFKAIFWTQRFEIPLVTRILNCGSLTFKNCYKLNIFQQFWTP